MYNTPKFASVTIQIGNKHFYITFFDDRIGVCKDYLFGKVLYMSVESYQDIKERYKLLKTKIKAKRNAADIYDYLVDCSAFNRETEKALEIIEHIKKYGHGIR